MNPHIFQRVVWGLVLIAAGVFFMLSQIGLVEIDLKYMATTYWPVILIFYGVVGFLWQLALRHGGAFWSLMLSGVGTIFLLHNLGVGDWSLGQMFQLLGPVALILFGLNVMFRPRKRAGNHSHGHSSEEWRTRFDDRKAAKEALRNARREAREQYRDAWKRQHQHQHQHQHHATRHGERPIVPPIVPPIAPESPAPEKRELTDEEKAVLKDIHGEIDLKKYDEPWDAGLQSPPPPPPPPSEPERAERVRRPDERHFHQDRHYSDFVNSFDSGDTIHRHGFIGDVHLGKEPWELKPLFISHFIGDSVVDLTRAIIPLGETRIHVTAFIGDVKILVPNGVDVQIRISASSFIGDMKVLERRESGFFRTVRTQTAAYDEADRKLIITTSMFIGDVTIKKIG